MPETKRKVNIRGFSRHRGRLEQIRIYLGKFLRMFIYQNDWKVMPMAAVIGALVGLVIYPSMFVTMEGTLFGSFALSCVSIWNGCFNSIQVVCRERGIIKREHRSGMHVSSYVIAHMIYQALLCLIQSALMTFVCLRIGVRFPQEGFLTNWFLLDFGISIFLVTYASDMMGLLISSIVHSTTTAMTVMPFLLIFQLIFSGGFFSLPSWSQPLTKMTISHYSLRSVAALADYNDLPAVTAWNTLNRMKDAEVGGIMTVDDLSRFLENDTVREKLREIGNAEANLDEAAQSVLDSGLLRQFEGQEYDLRLRLGDVIDGIGREKVRDYVNEASRLAGYRDDFAHTDGNITWCWTVMGGMSLLFAVAAMVALKFIDKDKR